MFYNFMTNNEHEATAALIVYATWRSRDTKKFKISLDCWGQVERAIKSVAKRAESIEAFIEKFKPKLCCPSLKPFYCRTSLDMPMEMVSLADGSYVKFGEAKEKRKFLVEVLQDADHKAVLDVLYNKASKVVLLTRDRLEKEKPIESQFTVLEEKEN